jgi:hypothetical protein
MAIDTESLITLILGTGSVTTVLTLLGTYFLNRKQKNKDRKDRINDKMIANVYSPFYFFILQIVGNIGSTMGNFIGLMESNEAESELSKKITIDRLKKINCPLFCSNSIKEILSSHIGFIKPKEFRRELAFYFQVLNAYENEIIRLVNDGFNDNLEAEKKWIANMLDASTQLVEVSTKFLLTFDKLMSHDGDQKVSLVFQTVLSKETFTELNSKIYSRNILYVKSYEEKNKLSKENKNL